VPSTTGAIKFSGDFLASGKDQLLLNYNLGQGNSIGAGSWLLGTIPFGGGPASWNSVANTMNTIGDLTYAWFSVGNFLGNGKDALLLYPCNSSDTQWRLGTFGFGDTTNMSWSVADNTPQFGWLNDRRVWTGDFLGDGRDTLLLYDNSVGDWWLGTFPFGSQQMTWSRAGNSNVFDVDLGIYMMFENIMLGDFVGDGKDALLLYAPKDGNWWLGAIPFGGNQVSWRTIGSWTNNISSTSPIWTGDLRVNGKTELLYYDDNFTWWLGSLAWAGNEFSWQTVGTTPALASSAAAVAWANNYFLGDDQWDILMISPDGALSRGTFGTSDDQMSWIPAGSVPGQYAGAMGDFFGNGKTSMLYSPTGNDQSWLLGTFAGTSESWVPVLPPG
jgi:hypothetical protein